MAGGCTQPPAQDKLSSMGLMESVIGRDEVKKAMHIVNKLANHTQIAEIKCGWEASSIIGQDYYYFLTQPEGLPLKTIAQTSNENKAIFISSAWRSICDQTFRLREEDSVLRTHALVLVLLHELGHLVGKADYVLVAGTDIRLESLQLKNQQTMNEEIFADFFAAEMVKNGKIGEIEQLLLNVEELYNRVDYYFESRYNIHGGGLRLMLAEPAKRFGDLSDTHPNLNLRMHLISYLIKPTPDKLRRLQWIQEERKLWFDTNTFTPDIMDQLDHLKLIEDDNSVDRK